MKNLYCFLFMFLVGCVGINNTGSIQAEVAENSNCSNLTNDTKSNSCTVKLTYNGLTGGVISSVPLTKSQFTVNDNDIKNCPSVSDAKAINTCKINIYYKSTNNKVEDEVVFTLSNFLNKIKTNPIKLSGI